MTDSQNIDRQPLCYLFYPKHKVWLITYSEDKGLIKAIERNGIQAKYQEKKDSNGLIRRYWHIPEENFESIRPLLDLLGYRPFIQESAQKDEAHAAPSAAYSAPPAARAFIPEMTNDGSPRVYSVHEINALISKTIKSVFSFDITLKGELIDYRKPAGHVYFSLVDMLDAKKITDFSKKSTEKLQKLSAVIWQWNYARIQDKINAGVLRPLENGMVVQVTGKLEYFAQTDTISIHVNDLTECDEQGEFIRIKLEIEEKLRQMGIHDRNKDLPMPILPLRIAMFSQSEADGYKDFKAVFEQRPYPLQVTLFRVRLQGQNTESSFREAFKQLEMIGYDAFDIALILRGGGSASDLGCFNNFYIAAYIAKCPLKFLIGLGHEKDRSVLDEIADRESNPRGVAERIAGCLYESELFLQNSCDKIRALTENAQHRFKQQLQLLISQYSQTLIQKSADEQRRLDDLRFSLCTESRQQIHQHQFELQQLKTDIRIGTHQTSSLQNLVLQELASTIRIQSDRVCAENQRILDNAMQVIHSETAKQIQGKQAFLETQAAIIAEKTRHQLSHVREMLERYSETIEILSPQKIFERGFVALTDEAGNPVSKLSQIAVKDRLAIHMSEGRVDVAVEKISPASKKT